MLAPLCGTSCKPIPKTTAQTMNRNVKRNFAFGFVTLRTHAAPPSVESAALSMITIIAVTTMVLMPNGMGCWKATRNSCIVPGC